MMIVIVSTSRRVIMSILIPKMNQFMNLNDLTDNCQENLGLNPLREQLKKFGYYGVDTITKEGSSNLPSLPFVIVSIP